MKKSLVAVIAALGACFMAVQGAEAKTLEDILKEKGVITEADYKEVTKSTPISYKLGKGFTLTSADEKFQLSIGGLMQVRYTFLDNDTSNDVSQFNLAKGRLIFSGYAFSKDLTYMLQFGLEQSGDKKMLENAYVKYKFVDELQLTGGQTKLVYSRQNMSSVGNLQFVAVSPVTAAFSPGYDLGAVVGGKVLGDLINYDLSVSNGAGQTSTRVTAGATNSMAFLAHLQVNPLGAFGYAEGDPQFSQKPLVTVGSSFYRNILKKTAAGTFETTNNGYANATSGWVGRNAADFNASEKVDINSFVVDTAFKWMGAFAQAEYFWGQADGQITNSTVRAQGYYLQAGYCIIPKKLEAAVRYSYLDPNRDVSNNLQTEVIGALSYYFNNHNLKLQADVGNIHKQGTPNTDDMQFRMQATVTF
ncbi:MAG: porin [Deltaproteobacteria bacterium]|nr:porin [Deltaproteobacteria bacterium]TLN01138.1 MAG: porin [bacterium]